MTYCIICKEIVDSRYALEVCDRALKNCVQGHVCRHCYHTFIESKHHRGFFRISRLMAWARHKKDSMRVL